jgi:hypothetical protein
VCIGSEIWLRLTFGRGWSVARHEQKMDSAFHESGACSVGLLEPLEFIVKLVVDRQRCRVPTRVRREAVVKQIEAAQLFDVEMIGEIAPSTEIVGVLPTERTVVMKWPEVTRVISAEIFGRLATGRWLRTL